MKATRRHESNLVAKKVGPWVRRGKNAILGALRVDGFVRTSRKDFLDQSCTDCTLADVALSILPYDFKSRSTTVVPQ